MKRLFMLSIIFLIANSAQAESVYIDGGHAYLKSGNTVYGSDGSRYVQSGNMIYGSDGSRIVKYGDHVYISSPPVISSVNSASSSYLPAVPDMSNHQSGYDLHREWKNESGFKY